MTWVRTGIAGFDVGDRIRFTNEETHERVEAAVLRAEHRELYTDHRGGWYVWGAEDQGQLYRWVDDEPAAAAVDTWQPATFEQMGVGDRVDFTHFGDRIVGEVTHIAGNGDRTVARDDGRTGGGRGAGWLVRQRDAIRDLRRKAATPLTEEELAAIPARAVFCACCGYATGEFTKTTPTELYCVQCRALPQIWAFGGEPRAGLRNTGEGNHIGDAHHRTMRMTNIGATPGTATTIRGLADDEPWDVDDDEDRDEEPYGVACTECGGHEFRVLGIEFHGGTMTTYYRNTEGDEPGETMYFEVNYEDIDVEIVPGTGYVVCDSCGQRQHDVRWAL